MAISIAILYVYQRVTLGRPGKHCEPPQKLRQFTSRTQQGSEPQQDCEFLRALRKIKTRLSALLPICSMYGIGVSFTL